MKTLNCPFCGSGKIKIKEDSKLANGEAYVTSHYWMYAECEGCFSKTGLEHYDTLSQFTKYTVQDFRDNPILRATEEERYELYKNEIRNKIIERWNKRTDLTK